MAKYVPRKVIRGVIYKKCSCCGDYKPESEFSLKNASPDKIQYYCQTCNRAYCKAWAKANR